MYCPKCKCEVGTTIANGKRCCEDCYGYLFYFEPISTEAVAMQYRLNIHFGPTVLIEHDHPDLESVLADIARQRMIDEFTGYDLFVEHPLVLGGK